jgi:uncharacterized membrane protein (DUF106 family)
MLVLFIATLVFLNVALNISNFVDYLKLRKLKGEVDELRHRVEQRKKIRGLYP